MQVEVKSPESCTRILAIEAPFEEFQDKIEKAFVKYQKRLQIPGFRKGKAPMSIVKTRYKDSIESETLPEIIGELFQKACREKNVIGINQPRIEDFNYEEGKMISFSAKVEVRPEIAVKDYKGIKVKKSKVELNEAEAGNYIKYLQESQAKVAKLDRESGRDDYIIAEFQELGADGSVLPGRKTEKREYRIGAGLFGTEFDLQLEGMKAGEERRIKAIVPQDYDNEKIAGQEISFNVKVQEVFEKTLPELNDEFAKDQGHDTYAAFEADIKKRMLESAEAQEKDRIRREIIGEIVKRNDFDVPNSMVDNYVDYMFRERQRTAPGLDEHAFRESSRQYAVQQIKEHLVIEEIRKAENIEVTDADISAYVETASRGNEDAKKNLETYLKNPQARERLTDDLSVRKVYEFLEANANIK